MMSKALSECHGDFQGGGGKTQKHTQTIYTSKYKTPSTAPLCGYTKKIFIWKRSVVLDVIVWGWPKLWKNCFEIRNNQVFCSIANKRSALQAVDIWFDPRSRLLILSFNSKSPNKIYNREGVFFKCSLFYFWITPPVFNFFFILKKECTRGTQ